MGPPSGRAQSVHYRDAPIALVWLLLLCLGPGAPQLPARHLLSSELFSKPLSPLHYTVLHCLAPKLLKDISSPPTSLQQSTRTNIYSSQIQQMGNKATEGDTKSMHFKCQGFNRKHADTSHYLKPPLCTADTIRAHPIPLLLPPMLSLQSRLISQVLRVECLPLYFYVLLIWMLGTDQFILEAHNK